MGKYRDVRKILKSHSLDSVCRYDACPRGCVVYKDFSGSQVSQEYADLQECPRNGCGHPRYVGAGSRRTACHYVYHFPASSWMRSLFAQPEIATLLRNDTPLMRPPTSVLRSFGYRDKVYNNPHLNGDCRGQGVILSADGVPYFGSDGANGTRGCWPVVLRSGNLPDGLSKSFAMSHMVAMEAQEHTTVDVQGRIKMERRCVRVLLTCLSVYTCPFSMYTPICACIHTHWCMYTFHVCGYTRLLACMHVFLMTYTLLVFTYAHVYVHILRVYTCFRVCTLMFVIVLSGTCRPCVG
jgi:hypothetical protein